MRKAFIFDFDDTLATTDCKVRVIDANGDTIARLTPSEYNTYQLHSGDDFDYTDFRNGEFIGKAKATFLMALAKEVYNEDHSVYILTARSDEVQDAIADFMVLHGIKAKAIHCVGGNSDTISREKSKILLTIIQSYDKIYFYDDCQANIEHAPQSEKVRVYKV